MEFMPIIETTGMDDLGEIIIPSEMRKQFGWTGKEYFELFITKDFQVEIRKCVR